MDKSAMKRVPQKYQILVISFWILFFPAYVHSYNLTEADFLHGSHLENPVWDGLLASSEEKWELSGLNVCCIMFLHGNAFFNFLPLFSFEYPSPDEKTSILRC